MRRRFLLAAASGVMFLLAVGSTTARAAPEPRPVKVDLLFSCHKGLVAWMPLAPEKKCGQVQMPQVKVFDGAGRLRFIGSALAAIQWAKSGQAVTPIPGGVVVRDVASEARLTHAVAPPAGHGWVTYYVGEDCPPCVRQLATFRSDVMPRLGAGTGLSVVELD